MSDNLAKPVETDHHLQNQIDELESSLKDRTEALKDRNRTLMEIQSELNLAYSKIELKARDLTNILEYQSEMLNNIFHQLRTPLNTVLAMGKQIEKEYGQNETDGPIQFLMDNTNTIRQFLQRIDQVITANETNPLSTLDRYGMPDFINNIEEFLKVESCESGATIGFELGEDLPDHLFCSKAAMIATIKNVLHVLATYHPDSITFKVYRLTEDIHLSYKSFWADQCIAFEFDLLNAPEIAEDADIIHHIFEFDSPSTLPTDRLDALGRGTYTALLMGGGFHLDVTESHTKVKFMLPQKLGYIAKDDMLKKETVLFPVLKGEPVLLVGDDPRFLFGMAKRLRKQELIPFIANSSESLLEVVDHYNIDKIFIGIQNPDTLNLHREQLSRLSTDTRLFISAIKGLTEDQLDKSQLNSRLFFHSDPIDLKNMLQQMALAK